MKPEELRIGNFVKSESFEISRIVSINALGVIEYVHYGIPDSEFGVWREQEDTELCGIPLTEEWLLKMGFVDHETFWSHTWGTNGVVIITYSQVYKSFMYQLAQSVDKVITTVHQLQNLYFALTGQELKLA